MKRIFLVYQGGIANVFEVDSFNLSEFGRKAKRLMQTDFRTAEIYCQGRDDAGDTVKAAACNMAGDIALQTWTQDLEAQPFRESFRTRGTWNY
jgi:hypothetical protein